MQSTYRRRHPPRSQIERLLTRLAVRQRDHLTAPWQVDLIPDVQVSIDPGDN